MPIIDILIAVAVVISVIVGIIRGFVKEAISLAALLVAIWAALYFGPSVGEISDSWISSQELKAWFGRVLVFAGLVPHGEYCWPRCSCSAANLPDSTTTPGGKSPF